MIVRSYWKNLNSSNRELTESKYLMIKLGLCKPKTSLLINHKNKLVIKKMYIKCLNRLLKHTGGQLKINNSELAPKSGMDYLVIKVY